MQDKTETTPAKTRRTRRKDDRPGEIIAAAMSLWAEKGFAATRLDDVAKAAGIAKGTIYLYFDSKEALFESAVQDRMVATINRVGEMGMTFEGNTEELLRHVFHTVLTQATTGGTHVFIKVLISEGHRFPDLVQRYHSFAFERGGMVLRMILERGVARGELHPKAAETDPRLIMSPIMMSALWDSVFNPNGPPENDNLVEDLLSLVLDGLRLREA